MRELAYSVKDGDNMNNPIYVAIDGGGTKTEYLLLGGQFQVTGRYLGGCVNHDLLPDGWNGTLKELQTGIQTLLEANHVRLDDLADVVAGLSGVDTRSDQKQADGCMRAIGVKRFLICNDGFLPVKAECPGGYGISYNCGTGVCCAGINEEGQLAKIAGLDEWSGDAGGGRWIVTNVFLAIYEARILRGEETPLASAYQALLSLHTEEDLIDSLTKLKAPADYPEVTKNVIRMFFTELESGDKAAQQIADQMLKCAADSIRCVYSRLNFPQEEIPIVLTGSILTKAANRTYLDLLEKRLQREIPGRFRLCMVSKEPVWGAVRWLEERKHRI